MEGIIHSIRTELMFCSASGKISRKDYAGAREILLLAHARIPAHPGISLQTASVHLLMREFDECEAVLGALRENSPENPVVFQYLGILGLYQSRLTEAAENFKKSLELEPQNQLGKNYLALCSILEGDAEQGLRQIKKEGIYSNSRFAGFLMTAIEKILLKKNEPGPAGPGNSGSAQGESHPESARAPHVEQAQEEAQEQTGVIAGKAEDSPGESTGPEKPEWSLSTLLIAPILAIYYWFLGTHQLNHERFPQAVKSLSRVLELSPDTHQARFHLGEAYFYQDMFDKAFEHFIISHGDHAENPEVLYYLGKIYQERGNFTEAQEFLKKAVQLFPKMPEALYSLGQIALSAGDERQAQDYFEQAAEYDFSGIHERIKALENKLNQAG